MEIVQQLTAGLETDSCAHTQAVAAELAGVLPVDTVLVLIGDLGAGKTTFVQGLARAWGISGPVSSPTFAIYSLYRGSRQLIHVDAYRLEHPEEADWLLIEDLLQSPWCLAVEWPEKIAAWWLEGAWALELSLTRGGSGRHLRLRLP